MGNSILGAMSGLSVFPAIAIPADDPSRGIFPMRSGLRARLDARSDFVLHSVGPPDGGVSPTDSALRPPM